MGRQDYETETLIGGGFDVAHTLRGTGFDASEDGTGRGTPLVPVAYRTTGNDGCYETGDQVGALTCSTDPNAQVVAFALRGRDEGAQPEIHGEGNSVGALRAGSGGSSRDYVAASAVRRLTPTECERLQGFPDGYTRIPLHNKKPTDVLRFSADGPRYKALGNSMAVPVMRWIGERIAAVSDITALQVAS